MISRRICRKLFKKDILVAAVLLFIFYTLIFKNTPDLSNREDPNSGKSPFDHAVQAKPTWLRSDKEISKKWVAVNSSRWFRPDKDKTNPYYECTNWFHDSFEDNLNVIRNYPRGIADRYLWKIGGNRKRPNVTLSSFPVIVTAANAGFYGVTQGLLKSIHDILMPKYKNIKIIYYDLGLKPEQYKQLVKNCNCEVRKFPFDDFPPHVRNLKTYTWKPIIVQQLLMEFGFVWWADSSVRFTSADIDRALDFSKKNSFLLFTYGPSLAVAFNTDKKTMRYLGEDPCKYRHFGENEATFVLFHFDEISRVFVNAWAACALNKECMCPAGTAEKLYCNAVQQWDGRCHRFDQAVLSILFRRLYHKINDYPLVDVPFKIHTIRRGETVKYFNSS